MRRTLLGLAIVAMLAACTTTPTAPPQLDLPVATVGELALERWWTQFNDPLLTALIDEALAHNLDLRAAMTRVESARAQVTLAQADLYPNVNLGVGATRSRATQAGTNPLPPGFSPYSTDLRVGLNASYEVDLWNKFRTATRAAQEDLLASQFARETVRTVVAATVAQTYFQLLATDAQLRLLRDTLSLREQTVELQRDRFQAGVIGEYEFAQAEAERAAVQSDIAATQRAAAQYEAALAVVLGRSPREVFEPKLARSADNSSLDSPSLISVPTIPAGLPSNMLERRPDIRQVQEQLVAANLRIDVARADYFPSLSLTGAYGSESGALRNLFSGPAAIWSIAAALAQPLIGFKAIEANVEARKADRDQRVVTYEQTVQTAFHEAHDALVANQTTRDTLAAQSVRRERLQRALELSNLRYTSGYSPYLEVLDAQRQLLQAQTLQILAARDVRLAVVDLAKALGGGWEYKTDVAGP